MGKSANGKKSPWYDDARKDFADVDTLAGAAKVVWTGEYHPIYQHYTTLSRVIEKISARRWWLSRCDSDTLNDRQESLKFGSLQIAHKTYQASFVHGAAESAALWGLYCPSDPFGIRITLTGEAIKKWLDKIRAGEIYTCFHKQDKPVAKVSEADVKDIIYAAVGFKDVLKSRWDMDRTNGLQWAEINSKPNIKDLESEVKQDQYTGWLKDYEWRHERESRLCVRISKTQQAKGLFVKVPSVLIKEMKFTFSPWLPKEYEPEVEGVLISALKIQIDQDPDVESTSESRRFRRSVLQGAMNLSRQKSTCQILEKCLLEECQMYLKKEETRS